MKVKEVKAKLNAVMDLKNPLDTIEGLPLSVKSIEIETVLKVIENEAVKSDKVNKIIKQTPELINTANSLKVISDQSMTDSKRIQDNIGIMIKVVETEFKEFRDKTNQLHKRTKTLEDKYIDPLKKVKQELKDKNSFYYNEKEKARQELIRKEEDRIFKENLKRRKELEDQRQEAIKKGNAGKIEEKNRKIEELSNMPEFLPPDLPDKIEGENTSIKFEFKYEASITDWHLLLRYIIENKKLSWLDINMKKINKDCKADDISGNVISGLYVKKSREQSNR